MMTNLQAAQALSQTIRQRLFATPGASRAIAELEEAAVIAAFLVLLTETLTHSVDAKDVEATAGSIQHLGGKLDMLTARLPFETPSDLADVLREAHAALAQHSFAPPVGKKVVS